LGQALIHFLWDGVAFQRVEGGEQRPADRCPYLEKPMIFQHLDRRDQGRGGDRAVRQGIRDCRLGRPCGQARQPLGLLFGVGPAAVLGFGAGAGTDVPLAPADAAGLVP
jgi:hypothetical protein